MTEDFRPLYVFRLSYSLPLAYLSPLASFAIIRLIQTLFKVIVLLQIDDIMDLA